MKKVLLVAAVAAFAMTSCKKEYTCECTISSNAPGATTGSVSETFGKMKKKDAESKCEGYNSTYTMPGIDANMNVVTYNYTQECKIK